MIKFLPILFISLALSLMGCVPSNAVKVKLGKNNQKISKTVSSVSIVNNQLQINGSGFSDVTSVTIKNGTFDETFSVESKTSTQIIANATQAIAIGVGEVFDLLINTSYGAATFAVTFDLDDHSVDLDKLSVTGATSGQVLAFNGTDWAPSTLVSWTAGTGGFSTSINFTTGNVGIGTASPATLLHLATGTTAAGITTLEQASATSDSYDIKFRKARGTVAVPTVITTGDELGTLQFNGYSGAGGYVTGAAIKAISEGTIATTRVPSHLSFWTGTDAAPTVLTERMRIDKAGNVGIGTTAPVSKLHVGVDPAATANYGLLNIGAAPFDGATADFFAGDANGTGYAMNLASGFNGNLVDLQVAGVRAFKIDFNGAVTTSSDITATGITVSGGVTGGSVYASSVGTPYFYTGTGAALVDDTAGGINFSGVQFSPASDAAYDLGSNANKWRFVYSTNVLQTSDSREKKEIKNSDLGLDFINSLRPVSYYWKRGSDLTKRYGLIAQDIDKSLAGKEFGGLQYDKKNDRFSVSYTEFIGPMIKAIQEFFQKFTGVNREIAALKDDNIKMKKENDLIRKELCRKDPSYSFCKK